MRVFSASFRIWTLNVGRWALGVFFLFSWLALAIAHPPSAILIFAVGLLLAPFSYIVLAVNPALLQNNTDAPAGQSVAFGCQDFTVEVVGGGTATFVMEGFTCNQFDSEWIVTNNSQGNPNKQKGQQIVPTYETTLQHLGGATPKCPLGFADIFLTDMAGRSIKWRIAKVSGAGANDGSATKFSVTLRYLLNS